MAPKIDAKSMKYRGCVTKGFLERFWVGLWAIRALTPGVDSTIFGCHLATIFDQNSQKCHPKRHAKFDAEKVSKIHAKSLPK